MSPWVRLDENALDHPKFLTLVDYRRPFDLWVWGLSYAQKHLTDGQLPSLALPRGAEKAAKQLIEVRLWIETADGYQIHDYDEWNESRETVLKKRAGGKKRAATSRTPLDLRAAHGGPPPFANDAVSKVSVLASSEGVPGKPFPKPPIAITPVPDPVLAHRAAALLDTYEALYTKHRHGAKLLTRRRLDFDDALELCAAWDDERLSKLADIFLTTDDEWISGTDRSFQIFRKKATWADDRLASWEADRRKAGAR